MKIYQVIRTTDRNETYAVGSAFRTRKAAALYKWQVQGLSDDAYNIQEIDIDD